MTTEGYSSFGFAGARVDDYLLDSS